MSKEFIWGRTRWNRIPGYEDKYGVSEDGRFLSINYCRTGSPQILKQQVDKDGYLLVTFCKNGIVRTFRSGRVVATIFHPNPLNLPEINHEDGVKTNNHKTNVKWCTRAYNIEHSYRTGLKPYSTEIQKAAVVANNKLKKKPIFQYGLNKEFINYYPSLTQASSETKIDVSNMSACCLGKVKTAGGFIWSYSKL